MITMLRRGTAVLALGLVSAGVSVGAAAAAPAKKTAMFEVNALHQAPGVNVTIHSQVWVTPTQARADVKHPLQGNVVFLISNGFFYQLDAKSKKGMKAPLPPKFRKNPDNFDFLVARFAFDVGGALQKAHKLRTETVSGYTCDVMTATETQGQETRTITVWMPQKMDPKFPVKAVMGDKLSKPGAEIEQTVTITLSNIRLGVPIPADTFKLPKGYTIKTGAVKPPSGK